MSRFTKKSTTDNHDEMSFIEHLEILRWHLVRSVIAVVVGAVGAFVSYDFIFDQLILKPKMANFWTNRMFVKLADLVGVESLKINQFPLEIININMSGQFATHIKVSIVAGIILSFPYIVYETWSFIKPALYNKEKRHATGAVFYSSFLFVLGILFGYYLILPLSIHFLGGYHVSGEVVNQINLGSYISTVTSIVFAGGIVFELPILCFFLSKVGILTPDLMRNYRRHSFVGLLLLSAVITPPDVFSQILICIPLIILYEVSILISAVVAKNNYMEDEDDLDDDLLIE